MDRKIILGQGCGLIFDFDGVIVDSAPIKHQIFIDMATELRPDLGPAMDVALTGELAGAERQKVTQWLARQYGLSFDEKKFLEQFALRLDAYFPQLKVMEGFREWLALALQQNVKVAIVSAAPVDDIVRCLTAQNILTSHFDAVLGSGAASKSTHLKALVKKWQLPALKVTFFGDMPSDLQAAQEAGLPFVRVRSILGDRCLWPAGTPTVTSFVELLPSK